MIHRVIFILTVPRFSKVTNCWEVPQRFSIAINTLREEIMKRYRETNVALGPSGIHQKIRTGK